MNSTAIIYEKLLDYVSLPLIFLSAFLSVLYAVPNLYFSGAAELLISFLIPLFAVYYSCKSFKKAAAAGFCALSSNLLYYGFSGSYYSILFTALLGFICVKLFYKLNLWQGFAAAFVSGALFASALGLSYEALYSLVNSAAEFLAGKGALFGAVNTFYELAFSGKLKDLVYTTSYSGAVADINGIKSGVVNILYTRKTAQLLTGRYFVNISLTLGLAAAMFKRLKGSRLAAFICVCALAVIFGEIRLFGLFILLYNPVVYFVYLLCAFVCYLVPSLLDLRIGLQGGGSLFELFKYGNRWGYFIAVALVTAALMYFAARLVFTRFEFLKGRYLPKYVKSLVASLGGEDNLIRIEGETLYVKNPNLIDILKTDCEIHQNAVSLYRDDLLLLKEYFYGPS